MRASGWTTGAMALLVMVLGARPAMADAAPVPGEPASRPAPATLPATSAELYRPDVVWDVHLRFGEAEWEAMQPKPASGSGWGLLMGGGRRDAVAGRGPAASLASALLKRGDRDRDGQLTRAEAVTLAGTWFDRWDRAGAGTIGAERFAAGLDALLDPEEGWRGSGFPFSLRGAPGQRNGLASVLGITFVQVRADLEFAGPGFASPVPLAAVGVRYKGNGTFHDSRGTLKRPLKVDLNDFVKGRKLAGVTKLNFHNNVTDPGSMNELVAYQLYRDAGVAAPRVSYARVHLTVPGKHDRRYLGLYSLVENVDEAFARDRFGTKGGAILKPVTPSLFADLGEDWSDYAQTYDPKTDLTPRQQARIIEFCRFVSHADDAEFAARLGEYLEIDAFTRFVAVTAYLSALDSILQVGQNYYVHLHPATNRFTFIPWDHDHSFGQIFGDQARLTRLDMFSPWVGPNRFLERVFKVQAFRAAYRARVEEFARTIFRPERFHRMVDRTAAVIRPAVAAESKERLAAFKRSVAGGSLTAKRGFFSPRPPKSIKGFVDARTPAVLDQLAGRAKGEAGPGLGAGRGGGRPGQGPGAALAPAFVAAMDGDRDGRLSRVEFTGGLAAWFDAWDAGGRGALGEAELRAAVQQHLAPRRASATRPAAAPAAPPAPAPVTASSPATRPSSSTPPPAPAR